MSAPPIGALSAIRERLGLVVAVVLVHVFLAVLACWATTPRYRATVLVIPVSSPETSSIFGSLSGQVGSLAALAGVPVAGSREQEEFIALLRSRTVAERFMREKGLIEKLAPKERSLWELPGSERRVPTLEAAYLYFDRKVRSIEHDKRTGLLSVSMIWTDREEAASWANDYVSLTNQVARERAKAEADASLRYLAEELESTTVTEVRRAIFGLVETQSKRRMLATVRSDYAFRVIDPATIPDPSNYVSPMWLQSIVLALLAGVVIGGFVAVMLAARASRVQSRSDPAVKPGGRVAP